MRPITAFFVFLFPLFITAVACTLSSSTEEKSLHTRLGDHLVLAQNAETQARTVWDRVLFGEVVSCSEVIETPPLFDLTQPDADRHPPGILVRDHLNLALTSLQQAAQIWEQECQFDRQEVPLEVLRQAEHLLETAHFHLEQAQAGWQNWQD